MQAPTLHKLLDQHLWLSAQRAIYWEEKKALIASDLHFGKTGHFRKSGVPVPQLVYKEDLQRLVDVLHHFQPEQLIVVGDFFHSHANSELEWFRKWRADFPSLEIILVKGNHDILKDKWYIDADIKVVAKELRMPPFLFVHEQCEEEEGFYTFCGHIHPGVLVNGLGKQSLRFPCFYFNHNHAILPAFSKFTGATPVEIKKTDVVFAIVEDRLIRM